MNKKTFARLCLMLALIAALPLFAACSSENQEPMVSVDPPPPAPLQVEAIPFMSNPQTEIWRPGYWVLSGHDFAWVPGKTIPRPSPTAVWSSAHWMQHNYGWSFEQGHWE